MAAPFTCYAIRTMHWGKTHSFTEFVDTKLLDLRSRFGMAMWFLTRRRGEDWLLLNVCGEGYDLNRGDTLAWGDTICHRRVTDPGPPACSDVTREEAYRDAPITDQLSIRAYVGMPLRDHTGALFGTLCALDPEPRPDLDHENVQAALKRQARLLESALVWNLAGLDQQRVTEFFEEESRDPETGLLDDAGWLRILDGERRRCQAYGLGAMVLKVHGSRLDDEKRQLVADSLAALIRHQDMAAYLGSDRFAILLPENTTHCAAQIRDRLLDALNAKGILMRCEAEPLRLSEGLMQPPLSTADGAVH
ncbi:MAG: GAF domain-containing protein [Alcanivorax sp.]|nr:GAF domain-containing protein [Alcanivorax sp.]